MKTKSYILSVSLIVPLLVLSTPLFAAASNDLVDSDAMAVGVSLLVAVALLLLLLLVLWLVNIGRRLRQENIAKKQPGDQWLAEQFSSLESSQLDRLIKRTNEIQHNKSSNGFSDMSHKAGAITIFLMLAGLCANAQTTSGQDNVMTSPGMLIMLTLVLLPLVAVIWFIVIKLNAFANRIHTQRVKREARALAEAVDSNDPAFGLIYEKLLDRKKSLDFSLTHNELAGDMEPEDKKGVLINVAEVHDVRYFAPKRKAAKKHEINPELIRLIMWYLGTATLWLVVGTSVGEYIGIKFVSPDVDHVSWLSFGRLRPVHTNMVFWGWSSLAMIGLGYYVVPTVSNTQIRSMKAGYWGLILLNSAVIIGTLCLMAGINNGGGEYREYIWPVMALFASGIVVTLVNYLRTIAQRKTHEIYISNWYIVAALMFLTTIVLVGYIPSWQNGLGETIVQGYYMHQAVGMWFMLFNLGLIYYFLPQQLNTPIYSYSLGILAFWSQILFYTLIGTHHFLFSSIPWWLQTVAIVGSMGMLIPVFSGTTNFLMTFKGNYHKIARSYTLPFYIVGILFYFTGSTQGTAEAFRSTNLIWHFTDFTVAHSHITMYGIIAFMLWASIYTLIPRLTGKEPKQGLVGAHFWMALVGIMFYTIPLMIGGTLKGMGWVAGKPFIDGVILMGPHWLWRAIGGSLMWGSHLIFAWNIYVMFAGATESDLKNEVFDQLDQIPVNTAI